MQRVPGVKYLEPYKSYDLPLIYHAALVFPGETLPMILPQNLLPTTDANGDGLLFGLISREVKNSAKNHLYGVTCQVYEKGNDNRDNVTLKSRAYQRFYIPKKEYVEQFSVLRSKSTKQICFLSSN